MSPNRRPTKIPFKSSERTNWDCSNLVKRHGLTSSFGSFLLIELSSFNFEETTKPPPYFVHEEGWSATPEEESSNKLLPPMPDPID